MELLEIVHELREWVKKEKTKKDLFVLKAEEKNFETVTRVEKVKEEKSSTVTRKAEEEKLSTVTRKAEEEKLGFGREEEMKKVIKRINPTLYHEEVQHFIILVTREKRFIPFMQKLENAITESLAPAKTILWEKESTIDTLLSSPYVKLILIPLQELNFFPGISFQPHTLAKIQKTFCLPLEKIENYFKDQNKKKALWNLLKRLPLHDLLQ